MPRSWRILSAIVAVSAVIIGCAATEVVDPFQAGNIVWPDPPEPARIAYVGEFSDSRDLGIRESFWSRVVTLSAGAKTTSLVRPMAVAVTSDTKVIFVADPDAHCVHRYDLRRGRYRCLQLGDGEQLISPIGLALTDDEILYVSDSQYGRLYIIDERGKSLKLFNTETELIQPTGIAWDALSQLLHVADTGSQSIKTLDSAGALISETGKRGGQPGEVNYPTYLWLDREQELLVADTLNFRIQRFGRGGDYIQSFGKHGDSAGSFARPKGVAADRFGHIYVVDSLLEGMQIYSRTGELLLSIGARGHGPGEFWLPTGIFVTRDNTIFVADSYNKRVQVFRYVGPEQ